MSEELTLIRELRQRYLADEDVVDDDLFLATLDRVERLRQAILGVVRAALEDEDTASRLRGRLDEMEARLRRIERQAEGRREMALKAMSVAGLEHLEAPGLRIEVRRVPPLLVVSDESLIPDAYKVAQRARLDYHAIRDALKAGAEVAGAALEDAEPYLSVRTG